MTEPAETQAQRGKDGGGGPSMLLNLLPSILFGVVLPFVTYGMLTDRGHAPVTALLLSSLWPVADLVLYLAIKRRVDEFGLMMLVLLLLGALSAVAYNTTELFFVKDSAITGLLGLTFLGSLALSRPIMFYLGRKFATDGTPESLAYWNGLWRYPGFRRTQYLLTTVWGVAFLLEAAVRVPLAYVLPTQTMLLVSNVLPIVVVAALVTWTIFMARRGRARSAAAQAAAPAPGSGVG
ncbi:VC0807 family protein [Nonomuraea sp. NPDC050783]|uniref:VC0807 family protein n=1 Tax=Nonomuraea sp. NPDC050783 TaxID=3154634 RepID=UPI0034654865